MPKGNSKDPNTGKTFKINPAGDASKAYFENKYGTPNPEYRVEMPVKEAWDGVDWIIMAMAGNIACILTMNRLADDGIVPSDAVLDAFYGHIKGMGEVIMRSELGEEV